MSPDPCFLPPSSQAQHSQPGQKQSQKQSQTQELLDGMADARRWMCRWQRILTLLNYAAAHGDPRPDALATARNGMEEAHTLLIQRREELKRVDPRAWRIHEYGLALATEGERGVHLCRQARTVPQLPAPLLLQGDPYAA